MSMKIPKADMKEKYYADLSFIVPGSDEVIQCYIEGDKCVKLPYHYAMIKGYHYEEDKTLRRDIEYKGTLREYQQDDARQLVKMLRENRVGTINAPTGYGKTHIGAYIVSKFKYRTLIVVPSSSLKEQWRDVFLQTYDNITVAIVGDKDADLDQADVIICMVKSLHKIPTDVRHTLKFLLLDETQFYGTEKNIHQIMKFHPYYILGESGTPTREDGKYQIVEHVLGPSVIKAEEKIKWRCIFSKVNINIETERNMKGINFSKLINDIAENAQYQSKIINTILRNQEKHNFIVLTPRRSFCEEVSNKLIELGVSSDQKHGDKKTYKESKALIALSGSCATGFDERNSCSDFTRESDVIIICGYFKNKDLFTQIVGRVKRHSRPIAIFMSTMNSTLQNHVELLARDLYDKNQSLIAEGKDPICTIEMDSEQNDYVDIDLGEDQREYYTPANKPVTRRGRGTFRGQDGRGHDGRGQGGGRGRRSQYRVHDTGEIFV